MLGICRRNRLHLPSHSICRIVRYADLVSLCLRVWNLSHPRFFVDTVGPILQAPTTAIPFSRAFNLEEIRGGSSIYVEDVAIRTLAALHALQAVR